jgi:serine/threonine protein kinase
MDFSRFLERKKIARGQFGQVYQAQDPSTEEVIALKCTTPDGELSQYKTSKAFREIQLLIQFNHPCILPFVGWDLHNEELEIGTEFLPNKSLDFIQNERKAGKVPTWFNDTGIAIIVTGTVIGMRYIHQRGALHRDFKPANLLLDEVGRPQIADLGLCRDLSLTMTGGVGTPAYLAPEVSGDPSAPSDHSDGSEYSQPCDVFSFGVTLFETVTGRSAFTNKNVYKITQDIRAGKRPTIPESLPDLTKVLIEKCWDDKPGQRPSFDAVYESLKSAGYRVLPGVDTAKVAAYVAEIETQARASPVGPVILNTDPAV